MRDRLQSRPLAAVLLLEASFLALVILGAPVLQALFPSMPRYSVRHISQSLVLVLIAMAGMLVVYGVILIRRLTQQEGRTDATPRPVGDEHDVSRIRH